MAEVWREEKWGNRWLPKPTFAKAARLAWRFATVAWDVLEHGETKNAIKLLEWFQKVGQGIGQTDRPARWRVPETQFLAGQWHYFQIETGQVQFRWGKKVHRPRIINKRKPTLDKADHTRSLAPNVIHSLDAAHLMLVVRRMQAGNRPVGTVHDGFATLATHAQALAAIFWEEMLTLYRVGGTVSVGQDLETQFRAQCPNIPPFHAVNTLPDIGATLPHPLR